MLKLVEKKKHVFVSGINKIIGIFFTKTFSNKGLHIQNNVNIQNIAIWEGNFHIILTWGCNLASGGHMDSSTHMKWNNNFEISDLLK